MGTFVTTVHIVTCVLIIIVVLMQSGKGADISATLGGSSNTVFGSSGGANFFTKTTFALAAIFMFTSLGLTVMGGREKRSVFDGAPSAKTSLPQEAGQTAPVAPTAEAAKAENKAAAKEAAHESAKKQVE
ncbi:MAG: preprotein translocase subunit SecG [Cryobacterium sp.]|nr:preprotein translocase subunit SecG [Oligoflexia bacterium]